MRHLLSIVLLALSFAGLSVGCGQVLVDTTHTLDPCPPGNTKCDAMGNVLICLDGQKYTMQSSCPFVCLNGACTGNCTPGTTQCVMGAPQTCDTAGMWQNSTCPSGQVCNGSSCSAGCFIDGSSFAAGTTNPGNTCQTCQPSTSTTAWTNLDTGASCASGEVCNGGVCGAGCFVGGTVFPSGMANPNNSCQSCQPTASTMAWSNITDGMACGNGQVCGAGQCGTQCDIGGIIVTSGGLNPSNACQSCQPGMSTTAWTNLSTGSACGAGQVCNAGTCAGGCFVGATVYSSGDLDPSNACQSCQPSTSTTAFTNLGDGTTCATGEICHAGSCASGCEIGGSFVAPGAVNPSNVCQTCVPATSTTSYSTSSTGTACGSTCANLQADASNCGACGRVCPTGGTCSSGVCVNVFSYTGADQTYTVPAKVCGTLKVEVWGAGGGGNQQTAAGYVGGGGGYTEATLTATAGEALTLIVGQGGSASSGATYGGGGSGAAGGSCTTTTGSGGGRSAVRVLGNEMVTAGGGGGTGCNDNPGGSGGGLTGGPGFSPNPGAPTGGTQTAGGTGSVPGTNSGTQYQGGNGLPGGGGGGGGWYGGGAEGSPSSPTLFGSGAGGSGYCAASLASCTTTASSGAIGAHQTGDWVSPAGNGGTSVTNTQAGNGMIVVRCGN